MQFKNKYFLLRHGQTIYQKNGVRVNYQTDADSVLSITEDGKEMIKASAEKLKKDLAERAENIDIIFSSPALRTKQSTEIAAKILNVKKIIYDGRLVDIRMGEFMGKTYKEYEDFFSEKSERFTKRPAGGEDWNDIILRLKSFLNDVEKEYYGKNILIVSHADPLWLLAGLLKGFTKDEQFMATRKSGDNLYPDVGELIKV